MLTSILEVLSRKSLSMSQLSGELGYSVRELESALEQMEHMGYVHREFFGQACSPSCGKDPSNGDCEGCSFHSSEAFAFWVLTEKGQILLGQNTENNVR